MAVSLITSRRRQLETVVDLVIAVSSLGFHLELCRLELSAPRGFDPRREQERRSTMPQRALKVLAFNCSLKSANGREKSSTDVLLKQLLDA
jgi:hypothetical protein